MLKKLTLALVAGVALLSSLPDSDAYAAQMCSTYRTYVYKGYRKMLVVRRYCWDTQRYGTCGPRRACE